jgi:putative transcriptional regulator
MKTKTPRKAASKAAKVVKRPSIAERAMVAAKQVNAHRRGEHVPGLVVHQPVDVKALREKTGLSQTAFAARFGFSPATVRDWEQNRRMPERPAQILLGVIEAAPEIVQKVVERQFGKAA